MRILVRKVVLSVLLLALAGGPAAAMGGGLAPLKIGSGDVVLTSVKQRGTFSVSNAGSLAGRLFLSASDGRRAGRVVVRDALSGRRLYVGPLARLVDVPVGRVAAGGTRRFAVAFANGSAVSLRWTAAAL